MHWSFPDFFYLPNADEVSIESIALKASAMLIQYSEVVSNSIAARSRLHYDLHLEIICFYLKTTSKQKVRSSTALAQYKYCDEVAKYRVMPV